MDNFSSDFYNMFVNVPPGAPPDYQAMTENKGGGERDKFLEHLKSLGIETVTDFQDYIAHNNHLQASYTDMEVEVEAPEEKVGEC